MKFRGEKNGRNRIGKTDWDRDYRSDSSRPHLLTAMTRAVSIVHLNGRGTNDRRQAADRTPSSELRHCTAYLENTRSHLGSTWSGKTVLTGRLSTFGVSGLYPCRRLTYRGACCSMVTRCPSHVKRVIALVHNVNGVVWLTSASSTVRRRCAGPPGIPRRHGTTLQEPRVATVLDRMYTESKNQMSRCATEVAISIGR